MTMELADWIRTGSLVVVFLILALYSDRNVWITADILAAAGFGIAFICVPNQMLDFQVEGKLDSVHMLIARIYGITLLSSTLMWWLTKDTRDGTVPITLIMSRVFSCSITMMAQFYCMWGVSNGSKYWTEQHVWFGMLGNGLWLAGSVLHLVFSSDFSTYPMHNIRLNSHLRVDSWLMMMISFGLVAFPSFIVQHVFAKNANLVHMHLCRCMGALGFGDAVISLQAPGFLHERDKRAQLCARLLWALFLFVPLLVGSLLMKLVTFEAFTHLALVFLFPLGNALVGYFTQANVIYHVPKDRSNAKTKST